MAEKRSTPAGFPIRAVARLTGLSLDTLRAWERRYAAVRPARGARGRLYSPAHVRRLQMLRTLTERGHAIGAIAALSDAQLEARIAQGEALAAAAPVRPSAPVLETRVGLQPVWDAIKRFDYAETDRQLGVLATLLAPRDFVHHVALPVMREIGEGWHRGQYSVAQEHMVTAILRNLLGSLVRLHTPARPSQMLLFAAPETDLHDFGLLAAAMLAAGGGMGITFLGPNCPAAEIVRVASKRKPAAVVLSLTAPNHVAHVRRELRRLAAQLPAETELWLSGEQAERATPRLRRSGVLRLNSFEEYEQQLARIGARF